MKGLWRGSRGIETDILMLRDLLYDPISWYILFLKFLFLMIIVDLSLEFYSSVQ